jgi:hypothetical protein
MCGNSQFGDEPLRAYPVCDTIADALAAAAGSGRRQLKVGVPDT